VGEVSVAHRQGKRNASKILHGILQKPASMMCYTIIQQYYIKRTPAFTKLRIGCNKYKKDLRVPFSEQLSDYYILNEHAKIADF
jgi:hypothetical protein